MLKLCHRSYLNRTLKAERNSSAAARRRRPTLAQRNIDTITYQLSAIGYTSCRNQGLSTLLYFDSHYESRYCSFHI